MTCLCGPSPHRHFVTTFEGEERPLDLAGELLPKAIDESPEATTRSPQQKPPHRKAPARMPTTPATPTRTPPWAIPTWALYAGAIYAGAFIGALLAHAWAIAAIIAAAGALALTVTYTRIMRTTHSAPTHATTHTTHNPPGNHTVELSGHATARTRSQAP